MELDPAAAAPVFLVIFALVALFILGTFVFIIVVAVRNARKARAAGHDPLTMQMDIANRAMDSELLRPARTTENRLRELDDLKSRGIITAEEYATARAEALRSR